MGRRKPIDQSLSVPVLLNEAQRASASGHLRYAKALWEVQREDATETLEQLMFGMKLFMTVPEKNVYQDRLLRFMATFASETKSAEQLEFIEALLQHLVDLSFAKDHAARWRACQLVHCIMGSLPGDAAISDEVADEVQAAMLDHLDDAKPNVRAAAVRALARLPIPDDDGDFTECPVTSALVDLLASDKSKDVRKAVLASLPAAPCTQPTLMERTRDESDDVRRVTYLAIAEKVRLEALGTDASALLLRRGLGDRTACVSEAASAMVTAWLDHACGGETLALLRMLGAETHPEEAELALKALMDSGRLNAVHIAKLAGEEGLGLRADFASGGANLLSGEEALFWRVVCECLATEATSKGLAAAATAGAAANIEAAAAGDRLEALEAALPQGAEDMIDIIAAHARAGPEHHFASVQLTALASRCMDFADATGRRAAAALLEELLVSGAEGPTAEQGAWRTAMRELLLKVHAAPAELADAMLSVLGTLHSTGGFGTEEATEAAWLNALQTVALMLECLPSARPALLAATPFGLADTLHALIQPGLLHASVDVRREAVRCLGLYCLLEGIPTPLASHLPVLRSYLAASTQPPAVRTVAAQALGDLAMQRGAKSLDALLVAETEDDPVVGGEPTVDLMLGVLRSWQEAFADVMSTGPRRRRGAASAGGSHSAEVEAVAELGTALTEALVRLVAVNEFRQAADERRGEMCALEEGEVLRLLVALLLLNFDAATEPAARLRQCLTVFFERFAGLSVTSQQYLATSLLPAARSAVADDIAAGRKTAAASPLAPQVVRFGLQLLQVPVFAADGTREPVGHEPLAELVLGEVLGCARRAGVPKAYLAALCKLPLALPMYDAGQETRDNMLRIQVYAARAAELLPDRAMQKDMEAVFERYAPPGGAEQPQLTNEQVDAMLAGVKAHVEAFCSGFPMPFGEEGEEEEGGAAPRPASRTGGRKAAGLAAESSSEDDSEGDAGESEPAVARRMPARSTRVAKTLAESDDSDDDEVKPAERAAPNTGADSDSSDDEEDEEDSESEEDVEEENAQRLSSARKARRASTESVAALRDALRENARIQ